MGSIPSLRTNMVGWCNLESTSALWLGVHVQIVHGLHLFAVYWRLINRVEWVSRKVANNVENKQFTANYVLTKWSVIFQWLRKISNYLNVEFGNCCNDLSKETQVKAEIPQNKMYEDYDHLGREILRQCSQGR